MMSHAVYERILDEARSVLPMEAVGLLGGWPNRVIEVLPLANAAGRRSFFVEPRAQFVAQKRLERLGLQIVAIYHSHPGGSPVLSQLDRVFAVRWPVFHVVIALDQPEGRPDQMRAYRLDESIREISICID